MQRTSLWAVVVLILAAAAVPAATAQGSTDGIMLRFGAGLDVVDFGIAAGAGAAFRLAGPAGLSEVTVDAYFSPYSETYTEGFNTFDYSQTLLVLAARANWLFHFPADGTGWYQIAGTGVFVGSLSWENYNRTTLYTEGNSYVASGTIINLGLGYVFSRKMEARIEIPIMIFFGAYGEAAAISIPLTVGIQIRTGG